ncbi:hypothetical protein EAE96_001015 [Botrytis aclada]|nr:hypothetical protein EAE96_001015 [Botrytis aclada]
MGRDKHESQQHQNITKDIVYRFGKKHLSDKLPYILILPPRTMRSLRSSPQSVGFNSNSNMVITVAEDIISPQDAAGRELDNEIASLQEQIASLKDQRRLQTATILSSQASKSILSNLRKSSSKTTSAQFTTPTDSDPLLATSAAQTTHNLENLYRACASITSFQIKDPDPNAVDNGHILGLRIEASSSGKFVRPYYIMLNKPYSGSAALRMHRHTVPPCIPLASLAAKYLPAPKVSEGIVKAKRQDLTAFVRVLRREITGYHLRVASIKHLRKRFSLDEKLSRKGKEKEREIADISAADAEAKQVRIEWIDGKVGRCVVGMNGEVVKCVIIGEDGRDRETERRVLGGDKRMEGIADRLMEGIY